LPVTWLLLLTIQLLIVCIRLQLWLAAWVGLLGWQLLWIWLLLCMHSLLLLLIG
jgi:hypothetical protein